MSPRFEDASSDPTTPSSQSDPSSAELRDSLDSLDDAVNYRNWIIDLVEPALTAPILEVGAGHGTFTESLAERGPVVAVEPDAHGAEELRTRYAGRDDVDVVEGVIDAVQATPAFGCAVMINVLEHIEDDDACLRSIDLRLTPGGHLVIFVPAFQLLYSDFDRDLGHFRRYRLPDLRTRVEAAGFEVSRAQYVNLPGFFSWLLLVRVLRRVPTTTALVRTFDRWIVPIMRVIESRVRVPFGQSIILVARRPLDGESSGASESSDDGR